MRTCGPTRWIPREHAGVRELGIVGPLGYNRWTNYSFSLAVPRKRRGEPQRQHERRRHGVVRRSEHRPGRAAVLSQPTAAQIQWIQANAIPFTTLDPNADFTELEPLKRIVGNAHIVGLGEARMHSEFFRMKSRLVSFLARKWVHDLRHRSQHARSLLVERLRADRPRRSQGIA